MKIGMFSDPHYSSAEETCGNRYNSRSLEKMKRALAFFTENMCDMVIILGDVTDTEPEREMEIKKSAGDIGCTEIYGYTDSMFDGKP